MIFEFLYDFWKDPSIPSLLQKANHRLLRWDLAGGWWMLIWGVMRRMLPCAMARLIGSTLDALDEIKPAAWGSCCKMTWGVNSCGPWVLQDDEVVRIRSPSNALMYTVSKYGWNVGKCGTCMGMFSWYRSIWQPDGAGIFMNPHSTQMIDRQGACQKRQGATDIHLIPSNFLYPSQISITSFMQSFWGNANKSCSHSLIMSFFNPILGWSWMGIPLHQGWDFWDEHSQPQAVMRKSELSTAPGAEQQRF